MKTSPNPPKNHQLIWKNLKTWKPKILVKELNKMTE